jgi:O-antigen ligase
MNDTAERLDSTEPALEAASPAGVIPRRWQRRPRASPVIRMSRDRLRIALFLLVVLTISRMHLHIPGIAKLRPLLLLTGLVAAFAYANPRLLVAGGLFRTWPAKVVAGLAAVACFSVPFGISMGNSGRFMLEIYSKNIILTFLIITACRNVRDIYTFTWAYVLGSGIIAFFALFVFKLQRYDSDFAYARLATMYTWDANDVVLVLLVGMALTLLLLQSVRDVPRRFLCLLILLFIGATVSRSGSRGGFLGMIAFGGALLVLVRGVSMVSKVVVLGVAVGGLVLWAPEGYWKQIETLKNPKADYNYQSIDGRRNIAKRGIGYMKSYPLFGVGIANFEKAECTISDKARNAPPGQGMKCKPPHNSYVQAGAETGVPGLVLWSSMIVGGVVSLRRWGKRLPRRWRNGTEEQRFLFFACQYLPVAFVGFGVTAYFLTFAWLEPYYILAALSAGTIWCASREYARILARRRKQLWAARAARVAAFSPPIPAPTAVA